MQRTNCATSEAIFSTLNQNYLTRWSKSTTEYTFPLDRPIQKWEFKNTTRGSYVTKLATISKYGTTSNICITTMKWKLYVIFPVEKLSNIEFEEKEKKKIKYANVALHGALFCFKIEFPRNFLIKYDEMTGRGERRYKDEAGDGRTRKMCSQEHITKLSPNCTLIYCV